ncbi:MAG: sulfatase-like hydrolase/transferase [Bacteroidales bacterium]|nr:sulfatase-like hydrolase/transferase [Bacteroidales bacterium]MCF8391394.1 sulfatase-like hydrolase/transferase [Bacteroidales bacterium]
MKPMKFIFNLLALSIVQNGAFGQNSKKPNLLFIMTDQQQYNALSYSGNAILNTPNLDRLASEGVWFENAHTQCAVCAPARATMFTGHTVWHTKMFGNGPAYEGRESGVMYMQTYDEVLAENGYSCEYYGKWHSPTWHGAAYNNPITATSTTEAGPSEVSVYLEQLDISFPNRDLEDGEFYDTYTKRPYLAHPVDLRYDEKLNGLPLSTDLSQSDIHGVTIIPPELHLPAWESGQVIDAIERLKDSSFSITCSFHHPHPPFLATEAYIEMFPPEDMPIPASINDTHINSPYWKEKDIAGPRYSDPVKIQYFVSEYYALVKEVDDRIGEILAKLDELGLTENTLIIFTSDHGEMLGAHGMRSKNVFYEESSHIPLMMKFPGKITPGTSVETPVSQIDLFATILDYLNLPEEVSDGKSLRGKIEHTENVEDNYIVTEWLHSLTSKPAHMVLKGGWKLLLPDSSASSVIKALYNLNEDSLELTNLIGDVAGNLTYKNKVDELESCFRDWYLRTHDDKSLNLEIEGFGKVTLNPAGGVYITGTEVTLTAEPYKGCALESWGGDIEGTELTKTVIMDSSINVSATFSGSGNNQVVLFYDNFENGYLNWNDGGADCKISSKDPIQGAYSLNLVSNSSSSHSNSNRIDLSVYDYVKLDFLYKAISMEAGENFSLQISGDDGSSYTTVKTWVSGSDFDNNTVYTDSIVITGNQLPNLSLLRWLCKASDSEDKILFDNIYISAGLDDETTGVYAANILDKYESPRIYPNPVRDVMHIDFKNLYPVSARIILYDMMGKTLFNEVVHRYKNELNLSNIKSGLYLTKVVMGKDIYFSKIHIQ